MEDKYTVEIFFILPGKKLDSDLWTFPADPLRPGRSPVARVAEHCVFLHRKYCDLSAFFVININDKRCIAEDPHGVITQTAIANLKKPVLHGQN